ncbi:MAG: ComF family protein [Fimbriimonas sp.]
MPEVATLCSNFYNGLLDLVYPPKCPLCGLLSPEAPCVACQGEMLPLQMPVTHEREGQLAFKAALYEYTGRAGQAVRRLKYARSTALSSFMASTMAVGAERLGLEFDAAVPVPIHWTRWCERGFNQAEILAAGLPSDKQMLTRIRATRPQVGLNREQRTKNLDGAFRASLDCRGRAILLIDDVVTSGQTARECAKALMEAGAKEVGILAFCGDQSPQY